MTPTIENPLSQSSENPLSKHWFYPVGFKLEESIWALERSSSFFRILPTWFATVCSEMVELLGDPAVGQPSPDQERHLLLAG